MYRIRRSFFVCLAMMMFALGTACSSADDGNGNSNKTNDTASAGETEEREPDADTTQDKESVDSTVDTVASDVRDGAKTDTNHPPVIPENDDKPSKTATEIRTSLVGIGWRGGADAVGSFQPIPEWFIFKDDGQIDNGSVQEASLVVKRLERDDSVTRLEGSYSVNTSGTVEMSWQQESISTTKSLTYGVVPFAAGGILAPSGQSDEISPETRIWMTNSLLAQNKNSTEFRRFFGRYRDQGSGQEGSQIETKISFDSRPSTGNCEFDLTILAKAKTANNADDEKTSTEVDWTDESCTLVQNPDGPDLIEVDRLTNQEAESARVDGWLTYVNDNFSRDNYASGIVDRLQSAFQSTLYFYSEGDYNFNRFLFIGEPPVESGFIESEPPEKD